MYGTDIRPMRCAVLIHALRYVPVQHPVLTPALRCGPRGLKRRHEEQGAIVLRASSAMSGTDVGYAATRRAGVSGLSKVVFAILLRDVRY
eukprot:2458108-Rhodomonas_salina.5